MSTELSNGVIIPEEYSDDWYDEMSINLRKLNDVITAASDNATDIQRLDTDKANQSDLTALTSRVNQNETDIIALQTAVSGALKREIVQTLPTEDISTTTIYMIRNSESSGTNIYDEYMYINSQWELIGTSATDFGNYYTKNETDNLLSGKVDNSTLGSYYTKTESDNLLSAKANQTDLTSLSGRVTQNETDITALQTAVSGALKREIVQSLPIQDISTTTIYMIRNTTTSGDNIYDEYMYINNLWELIGTSATDFSNYYTKTEIDTLLSGKANDSDVVHKSGKETIAGVKTFSDSARIYKSNSSENTPSIILRTSKVLRGSTTDGGDSQSVMFNDRVDSLLSSVRCTKVSNGTTQLRSIVNTTDTSDNIITCETQLNVAKNGDKSFVPSENSQVNLGSSSFGWKRVYAQSYYYGSNNVEFSTKFVTTDTAQTISGAKTFSDNISAKKIISNVAQLQINAKSSADSVAVIAGANASEGGGIWIYGKDSANGSNCRLQIYNTSQSRYERVDLVGSQFLPVPSGELDCGSNSNKWKSFNGLEPSSLSLPNIANKIDISSYITDLTGAPNIYVSPSNGYINLRSTNADILGIVENTSGMGTISRGNNQTIAVYLPVVANSSISLYAKCTSLAQAYFIPCQGNV